VFITMGAVVLAVVSLLAIYAWGLARTFDAETAKLSSAFPAESLRPTIPPQSAGPVAGGAQAGEQPAQPAAQQAQNILLLGSDTRGSIDGSLSGITGQRSDTIMVVHVPADRKHIYLMSILRDSWLDIAGHGSAKINAALSWGGVPLAVQTVEGLLGARIDHVAILDFGGFKGVTDALGGVDIDNPIGFDSHHLRGHYFAQGHQHLTGAEALAFARERYAFADGDFQRVRNQQLLISGIMAAAMRGAVLTDPMKISSLLTTVTPYLAVDDGLDSAYLAGLAWELRGLGAGDFTFFTIPTNGTGTSDDGQSIVNIDWEALSAVQQAFQNDTLDSYKPEVQTIG
jgi:LCP family protein required for cell wall assembly